MYHAPVPLDVDPQELEPAELADESVGADASSQRLRDAHLHNGQAQTRLLFAPFFALTGAGAALLVAWAMLGTTRSLPKGRTSKPVLRRETGGPLAAGTFLTTSRKSSYHQGLSFSARAV